MTEEQAAEMIRILNELNDGLSIALFIVVFNLAVIMSIGAYIAVTMSDLNQSLTTSYEERSSRLTNRET